jgi:hypothetical protein
MRRVIISWVALVAALVPVTGSAASAAVPAAASVYLDQQARKCHVLPEGGCRIGVLVEYWYKKGSSQRGVGWVYASRGKVSKHQSDSARWLYRAPGRSWKVGGGWKKLRTPDRTNFAQAWWGAGGHTGPTFPRNTQICTQYKGLTTRACVTLK